MTPVTDHWSTAALPPAAQFDAWREVIVDAHLAWDIPGIRCDRFPAYMHQQRVGELRVTDCTASARVQGTRRAAQIAQDDAAYLNVVLIAAGSERLSFGPRDADGIDLQAGMFTLWDSTRPMAFATGEHLRQVSLIVPEPQLLRRVPRVRDLIGRPIDGRQGAGGLFVDHLMALVQRLPHVAPNTRPAVLDSTLDLLALCLGEQPALPAPRLRLLLLAQLRAYIDERLTDASLDVAAIARHFRMTERNVHKLFEGSGETVCGHLRARRLAMCRRDLESPLLAARHVTEIAGHWGFDDPSQFSKRFRAAYGMSASECRAQAQLRSLKHHSTDSR
jgi:AraC-like DNA-binding protein